MALEPGKVRLKKSYMHKLIDTHAHLEEIADREQAITNAKAVNIIAIIAVGSDYESNQEVLNLAEVYKGFVYPALGLHPWSLKDANIERNLEFIEAYINKAVALGEVGLDYDKRVRAQAEKGRQIDVLKELLRIAKSHQKPAIIHSRYAWRDSLTVVDEAQLEKVVFHWYTGTSSVLRDIISRGYFVSATPAVEYHEEHRRAVKEAPLERLLLETDSPVVYRRGTEFEYQSRPAHVLKVLEGVSRLTGIDEAQIAGVTTANAVKFFSLPFQL